MDKYVVEVHERPQGDPEALREGLANALNLSPEQAEQLLRRLPGPVTKPVKESKARLVVKRFQELGIQAEAQLQSDPSATADLTDTYGRDTYDEDIALTPAPEAPRMPPATPAPDPQPFQAGPETFEDEPETLLDTPVPEPADNERRGILMTALGIALVVAVAVFIFFSR